MLSVRNASPKQIPFHLILPRLQTIVLPDRTGRRHYKRLPMVPVRY